METAPLTLAHTHARNASLETKRANPVAASEEHDLAAAEFASAAQNSLDQEAVRLLRLLEQHHTKLGQILKSAHEKPLADDHVGSTSPESSKTVEATIKPPRLWRTPRDSNRDLSSSIASNLATARGIPTTRQKRSTPISPLVSNQHADGQIGQDGTMSKASTSSQQRPSWAPPLQKSGDAKSTGPEAPDSPFQQFYNTFEGLISKMSAPLAFAGLPLAQAAVPQAEAEPDQPRPVVRSTKSAKKNRMDYSHLISNAAFRAVSANATTPAPGKKLEDSFFYVPTAGGTMSYAEMVNRADREEARTLRHHRQTSNLSNISEDDFVDANSTILNQNTSTDRPLRRGMTSERKVDGKTMEELALENSALKHISDTLSRRLHVFEMSSQTSTAALAQSIRSMPRSPHATPEQSRKKQVPTQLDSQSSNNTETSATGGDERTAKRISELEDILRKSDARAKRKDAENEKLRATIDKYRDKWDNLKAGAKARRERQQGESARGTAAQATGRAGTGAGAGVGVNETIPEETEG